MNYVKTSSLGGGTTAKPVTFGNYKQRSRLLKKFFHRKQREAIKDENPTVRAKSLLNTPFELSWPKVPKEVQQDVTDAMMKALQPLQGIVRGGKRVREKEAEKNTTTEDHEADFMVMERQQKESERLQKRKDLRSTLVFGINEVTRKLEKDELSCFIVCASSASICPTHHLQVLAATRQCPAICIRDFSKNVTKGTAINSLLVLGFKKLLKPVSEYMDKLEVFIHERCCQLYLPWVMLDLDQEQEESSADDDEIPTGSGIQKKNSDSLPSTVAGSTRSNPTPGSNPGSNPTPGSNPGSNPTPAKKPVTETGETSSAKPFDMKSIYIMRKDSDWLDDDVKIVPKIGGGKSMAAQDFIKLSEQDAEPTEPMNSDPMDSDPFDMAQPGKRKRRQLRRQMRKLPRAGYLPPHVQLMTWDPNRKKSLKKRKKK